MRKLALKEDMARVTEELTKVKVELATSVENNTKLTEEITGKNASLNLIRNKKIRIRKIAKKYKLQYEELVKTVRNKEMQIRKIAKKYKLQHEELAKTVEEDKKRFEGVAAAANAATAESAKKVELQLTNTIEIQSQLSISLYLLLTEKANNEKLKQELEMLRTANTVKEEKATTLLKQAKNKIVHLTVLKNSLIRELEASRIKIGAIGQRWALIKSQFKGRVSQLQKEHREVQAEKNREVEALQQKVTMLQRQLVSQASASKQLTTTKKTTTDPPMIGVAQPSAHTTEYMPASSSRPILRAAGAASSTLLESTQDTDTSDIGDTAQPSSHSQDPQQSENFVLLKSDVKWVGDTVTSKLDELNLWRTYDKALLQKFIPMKSSGKILHKRTCVYKGWEGGNRENYYLITEILDRNPPTGSKEMCVALDLNDLIKVRAAAPPAARSPERPPPPAAPLAQSEYFVLLKSDVKWVGDTVTSKLDELNLWKIEGKALLLKFIPMKSSGKILHKRTCVYTGWKWAKRENYYLVTDILDRDPPTDSKEMCVALDLNDLIKVRDKKIHGDFD